MSDFYDVINSRRTIRDYENVEQKRYKTLITDGSLSSINTYQFVCNLFGLEE